MKRLKLKQVIIGVLLCCIPFVGITAQEQQQPDTLVITLQDALQIALSESPTIKIAEKEIQRVRYAKKETVGSFFPTVSLSAAYQRALKKQKMYMDDMGSLLKLESMFPPGVLQDWYMRGVDLTPAEQESTGDGSIEVGRTNTFTGGLSASLPLIAPALWSSVNLTEQQVELALESARASKINLINQVSKAYYSVLMTQDSYDIFKRVYENSAENARIAKSKYEQQIFSEFEFLRNEIQVHNAQSNVITAKNTANLALLQLKMLMGIDMETEIKVVGNLSDFETNKYGDVMKIDTSMLHSNTDLKQFDIQTKQLEQSLKINKSTALPTLGLSFDFNYMSMVNDKETFTSEHKWFPTSNLSLGLSIPLFEGGKKHHKNKQIKIQLEEMELNRLNLERGLQLQVTSYLDNIKNALEKIEFNKKSLKQAEKAMVVSQKMYDVGMVTFLDVSNAELGYTQAGVAYNQSIYDYLSNKADLEKVLGNYYNE